MKPSSFLRSRITLLALVPGIACSLLIGSYLAYALIRDISAHELRMGNAYSEQLSAQAFRAAATNNTQELQAIAQLALEYPLVRSISFYNSRQQPLIQAGPRHHSIAHSDISPFSNQPVNIEGDEGRQLFIPILHTRLNTQQESLASSEPVGWLRIEFSHSFMLLQKYRTLLIDMVIVLGVLTLAFWVAMPFSDRLASTLKELAIRAKAISQGNTNIDMPTSDIAELQDLGDAINNMRHAFVEQQHSLQHHIDQSTHDLRETLETIEIQNIELDLARREAVQASRVKSEFLANTSHEIRTPLNSIIGFSRLLQKTTLTPDQQDYLENIRKSSENLLTIINDVLDLSKIEAGKLVLDYTNFNLHETLEEILQILAPGAHEKGMELLHMIYSDVPRNLIGDPLRFKQILTNLISNAIKFSEDGSIVVRVSNERTESQQVTLKTEITDSGPGLPNNNQTIFNAFTQLDSSSTREHSGTGLGLAISRKLVEQMGGEIGYHSEPGHTTFWFTVPFDTASTIAQAATDDQLAGKNILVYDKESLSRLAISHSLTAWGISPILADQPDQIIPVINRQAGSEQHIAAVILGWPVQADAHDTQQLQDCIATLNRQHQCPIILCTPTSSKINLNHLTATNLKNIQKPVTERKLHQTLRQALLDDTHENHTAQTLTFPHDLNTKTTLLTVDDNPSNLKLISMILHDMGFRVLEAHNGLEAIQLFESNHIDLVFMDIQMPIMDGIEATRKIRWLDKQAKRHTPVIALTAHALTEQRQRMLMSGLDDCLSKPASEPQLARMIEKWLNVRNQPPAGKHGSPEDFHADSSIVDRTQTLKASGGKKNIATEMLTILFATLDDDRAAINRAITEKDYPLAETLIHKLHGTCCYCGVPELKNCCSAMETLLKKQLTEHIEDVRQRFNLSVDSLLAWRQQNDIQSFMERI